jgi:ZIP family zinc transporter
MDGIFIWGILAGFIAGISPVVGALPALWIKQVSQRSLDGMLGFGAGVMLAATSVSLVIPAIEIGGMGVAAGGLSLGAIFVHLLDRWIPHEHLIIGSEGPSAKLRRFWLFVFAIAIHNFPEGLAVGIGFGSGEIGMAAALAIGIILHNLPEGLVIFLPFVALGVGKKRALYYTALTGAAEFFGALLGLFLVIMVAPLLPWGLAFAGGAMLFVVSDEIIPESHRYSHERPATFGLIVGFLLMISLATFLA